MPQDKDATKQAAETVEPASAKASSPTKSRRTKNAKALQSQVNESQESAEDLQYQQQGLVRYPLITNQQQADQYIQDLGLGDIYEIQDVREKALHLFGFFNFLDEQHESELYVDNLLKVFQLAVFFNDNYVYRYYLAWYFFLRGDRDGASAHIQDCVNKIKNKQTVLYSSLAQAINVQVMKNQINDLLIKLALPTLDETAAF